MMRERKSLYARLAPVLAGCAAVIWCSSSAAFRWQNVCYAARQQKDYTVLLYIIGSDLESEKGAASNDIEEMRKALKRSQGELDECVNIVVEYGGSTEWKNSTLAEAGFLHGRFELTQNGIKNLTELPAASMGDGAVLQEFLTYGTREYPAENYILIFWNHGEGPIRGYGCDKLYQSDSLTLAEMEQSFTASGMEQYHFPLVGFDACLMGGIETVYTMPDNVDYLVASAEEEPTDGWDYEWLEILTQEELSGEKIGVRIVDSYMDYYEEKGNQQPLTLGVFDCKAARSLGEKLSESISDRCGEKGYLPFYRQITDNRADYYGYNESLFSRVADIVDLEGLSQSIVPEGEERENFEKLYRETVIYVRTRNISEKAQGLSVYLPSKTNLFIGEDVKTYQTVSFTEEYKKFADRYADYLSGKSDWNMEEEQIIQKGDCVMLAMVEPEQIAQVSGLAFLYDAEAEHYLLTSETDRLQESSGTVSFTTPVEGIWMNKVPVYGSPAEANNGCLEYLCPVLCDEEAVQLRVRFTEKSGMITGVYPLEAAGGKTEPGDWKGGTVIPLYPAYTLRGGEMTEDFDSRACVVINHHAYHKGNTIVFSEETEPEITLGTMELPNLCYGFRVTDMKLEEYCYLAPMR